MKTPALDSAASQIAAMKNGKISATELLDRYLERIERRNPKLNAVFHLEKETAREFAKQAVHHDHGYNYDRTFPINGIQRPYMDLSAWSGLAVMACLPATVAPMGICPDGMPSGIQIIGPYLEDRTAMAVARQLEDITGGFTPPPGV